MLPSPFQISRFNVLQLVMLVSLVVVVGLTYLLRSLQQSGAKTSEGRLVIFCAAGMRVPLQEVVEDYQRDFGVQAQLQFGGSNTLLSQIEVSGIGDLYLAADESYLNMAKEKGFVAEVFPIARMRAVLGFGKGNPKGIQSVQDLFRQDVRTSLANPDLAAVGKLTHRITQKLGLWDSLQKHVRDRGVFKPTVSEVANDILVGGVDAGILWDSVLAQFPNLDSIELPSSDENHVLISLGFLTGSKNPTQALHFARYLTARDRGQLAFVKHHYQPVPSDPWVQNPQLNFFAGSVNRTVLPSIVRAFERRHGVKVNTICEGCGTLTDQMQAIKQKSQSGFPDIYLACDQDSMNSVAGLFQEIRPVSETRIVMAVQRRNPKKINSTRSLVRPGIRVALGQPDQCALGVLSQRLLESEGLYEILEKKNLVMQATTSERLIPSVLSGTADVALVYYCDALAEQGKIEIVEIESPLAQVIQTIAIAKSSQQKQLSRQLYDTIIRSRETFERSGFRWRLPPQS